MSKLTLSELLSETRNAYKSVDMRALIAKPKNEVNARWKCLFLKIRLTGETQSELEEKFSKKNVELGEIKSEHLKVVFVHRDIKEFDALIDTIRTGKVELGLETAELLGDDIGSICALQSVEDTKFTTDIESQGNRICAIYCSMRDTIENQLDILGITKRELGGLDVSLLRSWFDAQRLEAYLSVSVALLFTIYCKVFSILHQKLWNTSGSGLVL